MIYRLTTILIYFIILNTFYCQSTVNKQHFEESYTAINNMLLGKDSINFEKAVFLSETPYLSNKYEFESFQFGINQHLHLINKLIKANNHSDSIDFQVKIDLSKPIDVRALRYTSDQKEKMYKRALTNWAIFTYMTDTIESPMSYHIPFSYEINDPFGMNNWSNSQVINLLTNQKQRGGIAWH